MSFDWMRNIGLLAILALSAGCAATPDWDEEEELEAGGEEAPIVGGSKATAYPEAVLIDMGNNGQISSACSGALIAPKVVLTAGHCVAGGFNYWRATLPFAGNQTATGKGVVYDYNSNTNYVDPNSHDVGLILLSSALSIQTYPTVATAKVPDGTLAQNIGRINNGQFSNTALFISQPLKISDATNSGFPFDYIASEVIQPGDSGGPVVLANSHSIVAVNSGAGGGTQVLARVDLLYSWIKQQVEANGGGGNFSDPNNDPPPDPDPGPEPVAGKEAEPNNTYQQTNPLQDKLAGSLTAGDQDWSTWTVGNQGVKYNLVLSGSGNAQVKMWKLVNGQYYKVPNTSAKQINQTSTGPGQYFVVVYSSSGAPQDYTLTLTK